MASVDFPEIVVALILRHVSQKQRLQCCALVSTVWAAAARAATGSLDLVLKADNSNISVIDWINSHGSSLTSLRLGHARYSVVASNAQQQLCLPPCPQLRSFELCNISISLELSFSSSQLLLLSAATALTRLVLTDVSAAAGGSNSSAALPTGNLMALSALTALQHLEVDSLVLPGLHVKSADRAGLLRLPSALVPCLTQVKHLVLYDALTEVWALQQLSCLTGLCSLGVGLSWAMLPGTPDHDLATAAVAAAVQHLGSLTAFTLKSSNPSLFFDPAVGQNCFTTVTQLRSLQIHSAIVSVDSVDPAQLATLTDLQHLDVSQAALSPARALELLSWLPQLQDLTYLRLSRVLKFDPPAPANAYAALTASSNLQHLDLSNCILQDRMNTSVGNPWQQVFAPGKLLPQLTSLQVNGCQPELGVRSLRYLVRCCPALQRLDLSTTSLICQGFYEGDQLSVLLALTQLTSFTVRARGRSEAADMLRQMSQLRELDLSFPGRLGALQPGLIGRRPLLPLTQLRQLESLTVQDGSKPKLELHNMEPEGCPPDVWSQLRDLVEGAASGAAAAEKCLEGLLRAASAVFAFMDDNYLAIGAAMFAWLCADIFWEYSSGRPIPTGNVRTGFFLLGVFATKIYGRWHHSVR